MRNKAEYACDCQHILRSDKQNARRHKDHLPKKSPTNPRYVVMQPTAVEIGRTSHCSSNKPQFHSCVNDVSSAQNGIRIRSQASGNWQVISRHETWDSS